MQIPILSGIYADGAADFRTAYPRNLIPLPKEQGISKGYLRPAEGLVEFGTGAPGIDRGGIAWRGECYRVMGSKLCRVSANGIISILGDVGFGGTTTMDYSFDHLAIASGKNLYLYSGATLAQVTDGDLGDCLGVLWVDGYWMSTDGEFLVVTELNNPFAVNPLKYGSSEADPDPVQVLLKLRNEVYAINRYTTEVFDNNGGANFPFQRIDGALVEVGAIGTHMACLYAGAIAMVGSARNQPPSIYLIGGGEAIPLATAEIDQTLEGYTEAQLSACRLEARTYRKRQQLYLHLPDRTMVYDIAISKEVGQPVWFELGSSVLGHAQYRAQGWVWCHNKWVAGDPQAARLCVPSDARGDHYGQPVGWEFSTAMLYNGGMGAVVHELELVSLPGRVQFADDPVIWTSYSTDGETWSQEKSVSAGKQGERNKRLRWLQQGPWANYRIQRFRGNSDAHVSFARLEAQVEALSV